MLALIKPPSPDDVLELQKDRLRLIERIRQLETDGARLHEALGSALRKYADLERQLKKAQTPSIAMRRLQAKLDAAERRNRLQHTWLKTLHRQIERARRELTLPDAPVRLAPYA